MTFTPTYLLVKTNICKLIFPFFGPFPYKISVVNAIAIRGEARSTHICAMMSATTGLDAQIRPIWTLSKLFQESPYEEKSSENHSNACRKS